MNPFQFVWLLFSSCACFPYQVLFILVWCTASLFWPLVAVTAICLALHPAAALRKLHFVALTIRYMIFCNDKSWKTTPQDDPITYFTTAQQQQQQEQRKNKKDDDNTKVATAAAVIESKTMIFIRHGESTWNDTFNKGDRSTSNFVLYFVPNLIKALWTEWFFVISGDSHSSWFFDSPLSPKGVSQAQGIQNYLSTIQLEYATPKEAAFVRLLTGETKKQQRKQQEEKEDNNDDGVIVEHEEEKSSKESQSPNSSSPRGASSSSPPRPPPASQLVSSNLRRSMSTMMIGLQDRLNGKYADDKMLILPHLQEMSRNPDAISVLTNSTSAARPAWTDPPALRSFFFGHDSSSSSSATTTTTTGNGGGSGAMTTSTTSASIIDTSMYTGNKAAGNKGLHRMQDFCRIAFEDIDREAVICAGHSLWFRSFFRTFLPHSTDHVAKRNKLCNGGVVGFKLQRIEAAGAEQRPSSSSANKKNKTDNNRKCYKYMIDPTSITVLHGGF